MADKDPKDMTASELLRKAGNGYEGASGTVVMNLIDLMGLSRKIRHSECLYALADKIDAELAQARRSGLERAAKSWAKANGWPDFKEGEDFGAWLDRCAYKKPVDDCNEPVQFGDDIELHYSGGGVDKGLFQEVAINKGPVSILSFVGVSHARDYRYDSECDILKRPAPEALGADGKPVKEGETVYPTYGFYAGISGKVVSVEHQDNVLVELCCSTERFDGCYLTHTPPDTQQAIDDDATMPPAEYCAVRGIDLGDDPDRETATEAMVRDLLRRQRELDRKGGE